MVTELKQTPYRGARIALLPLAVAGGAVLLVALLMAPLARFGGDFVAASLLAYLPAAGIVAARFPADAPRGRFGPANALTLLRAAIACLFAGLLFEAPPAPGLAWAMVAIAAAAMLLDGADGWAARRTRTETGFGARFDMETDAAFMLILSLLAIAWGRVGPWALMIGAMRYLFVAAAWIAPRLSAPLPPSLRRKAVCVVQVAALIAILAPLPRPDWLADAVAAAALALLAWSFAVDILHLLRPAPPAGAAPAPS